MAAFGFDLTQIDGSTVAQLPCPVTELMPAITGCVRVHASEQLISGKHREKFFANACSGVEPKQISGLRRVMHEVGACDWCRLYSRKQGVADLPAIAACVRVGWELLRKRVIEDQ